MQKYVIAISGASGAMGLPAVKSILDSAYGHVVKALFLDTAQDRRVAAGLKRKYGKRIQIIYGDLVNVEDCKRLVDGADYVLHMAALIPPKADHDAARTMATNYDGTVNVVEAVRRAKSSRGLQPKLVHTSTVAVYGNRNYKHPWGRVGDPLLPSAFDVYAASKVKGERYVLESGLDFWAVIRQTALLHDKLLMNNIKDGLMFHTCWNSPLEWVTAEDCGVLMRNIVEYDIEDRAKGFWKKCFNIGGGRSCRLTGYDTFNDGFKMIGGSAESFLEPPWNLGRNFHGLWFADSDILDKMFNFRQQSEADFWAQMTRKHRIYQVARIMPAKLIKKLVIERLLSDENSPREWIDRDDKARIMAGFGSTTNIDLCPASWDKFPLLARGEIADGDIDYDAIRDETKLKENGFMLSHGYDESKADEDLDIEDMREAAEFRGGKCLSESMVKGDLYTRLKWQCHDGHVFEATPYTVLKAGHWCPVCCEPEPWRFDILAKNIPFFAEVWYDSHAKGENAVYYFKNGNAQYMRELGGKLCKM